MAFSYTKGIVKKLAQSSRRGRCRPPVRALRTSAYRGHNNTQLENGSLGLVGPAGDGDVIDIPSHTCFRYVTKVTKTHL